ncbi:MAG: hypothetical protein FJ009_11075 [Chloroflexi bacterium]|nr:hypothetical protein [Chloroflexota bacterium]
MPSPSKTRPVDALFGDDNAPPLPNYIVEPAQPITTVAPPSPDDNPTPAPILPPIDRAPTPPPPPVIDPDIPTPEPILVSHPYRRADDDRFAPLAERIERLYGEVKMDLHDSKVATDFCFGLLKEARQAVEARDYARAEFSIQSVDAKLKRAQRSMKAARGLGVIFLTLWELLMLVVGGALIALTYVVNLTLFGLPVVADLVVLLRAVGWGMIGGVIGGLFNLPWFVQYREYDPAYALNYFLRPFVGALLGAILFLLSQAGIVAGNLVIGDVKVGPIFLYVFAILAGFKQEYVGEFFDGVMRAMFRSKKSSK